MHAKPDLRVVLKWMIAGSGSVIADVIHLGLLFVMAEDCFDFFIKRTALSDALMHLCAALNLSNVETTEIESKDTAVVFEDERYILPCYGDIRRRGKVIPNTEAYILKENDGPPSLVFPCGLWLSDGSVCDYPTTTPKGIRCNERVELLQFDIWFEIASEYARIRIDVWGGQWWGYLEDDPEIKEFENPLKELSEIYKFFYDKTGTHIVKPEKLNKPYDELPWDSPVHELALDEYIPALIALVENGG